MKPTLVKAPSDTKPDRDITLTKLKLENYELKQKEKELAQFQSQIQILEQKISTMLEEKSKREKEHKLKEETFFTQIDKLKGDLNMLTENLNEKLKVNKDLNSDLSSYKEMCEKKDLEIAKITQQINDYQSQNEIENEEKKNIEKEYELISEGKKVAEEEMIKLANENSEMGAKVNAQKDSVREQEMEINSVNSMINKEKEKNDNLSQNLADLQSELEQIKNERQKNQMELNELLETNLSLQEQKQATENKIKEREQEVGKLQIKTESLNNDLESKTQAETEIAQQVKQAETLSAQLKEDLKKFRKEKDSLDQQLEFYKKEAATQKKLRESEIAQNIELINQKKATEKSLLNKDLETVQSKKLMDSLEQNYENVEAECATLSKELGATKEHITVLNKQNENLSRELDRVMETDEQIKKDLSRKNRIESVKEMNSSELQKSIQQLKSSQSPRTSPYKSPY